LAHPQLFPEDLLIDIQFMPQDGKILRKRAKVSSLDLSKTVFLKKPVGKFSHRGKVMGEMQKKQIEELNNRLTEINEYKEKVKKLSNNDQDLEKLMNDLKARLGITQAFTDKNSCLEELNKLNQEWTSLKFQLEKIDFKSFDLHERCEQLIKVHGIQGLCFEISDPIISAKARTKTFRFSSQKEQIHLKKAVLSTKYKGGFGQTVSAVGFGYGALGMASEEYTSKTSNNLDNSLSKEGSYKTKEAVATTRGTQEIAMFKIKKISLDDKGKQLIEEIGNEKDGKKQEELAFKFLDRYPSIINMGYFGVGGWFEYTATTRSTEMKTLDQLQEMAARQSEKKLTVAAKVFYGPIAAQGGVANSDDVAIEMGKNRKEGKKEASMTTTFAYECSGPTVYELKDLQKNLTNPDNLAVFPSVGGNHRFEKIYNIVGDIGSNASNNAAKVLENIIENGPEHFVREPRIPPGSTQKNIIVFGKTGSGKSLMGNALIGKYDEENGFKVSDSADSCTKKFKSQVSSTRKIKFYDTIGAFDTKYYKENVRCLSANKEVIADIIGVWKAIGTDGVHAIIFVQKFNDRITEMEAKFAESIGKNLFADAKSIILLVMTHSKEKYCKNKIEGTKWLESQLKRQNNMKSIYGLVGNDPSRVFFVDMRMPQDMTTKLDQIKVEQENVDTVESILNVLHTKHSTPVQVTASDLIAREQNLQKLIKEEKEKDNPNKDILSVLGESILCISIISCYLKFLKRLKIFITPEPHSMNLFDCNKVI